MIEGRGGRRWEGNGKGVLFSNTKPKGFGAQMASAVILDKL